MRIYCLKQWILWCYSKVTPSNLVSDLSHAAAAAKSHQLCPTLCDSIDGSAPGSPIPGILQATTLEWVAISFSNAWKWKVKGKSLSCVRLLATPWTAAHQAPPSMGFSRQEYWSGVPSPSPYHVLSANKIKSKTKQENSTLKKCCVVTRHSHVLQKNLTSWESLT